MTSPKPEDQQQWPIIRPLPRAFFKSPQCGDLEKLGSQVAFIGMPFDQGTFGRPGARFGPEAVRDAPRAHLYPDSMGAQQKARGLLTLMPAASCCRE